MNLLDQLDPLPAFRGHSERWRAHHIEPLSRRQVDEIHAKYQKERGEDWRPHTPGFEINGKGQIRTVDYEPPKPPETDIPIPCVVSGFDVSWDGVMVKIDLAEPIQFYAEPQPAPPRRPARPGAWTTLRPPTAAGTV